MNKYALTLLIGGVFWFLAFVTILATWFTTYDMSTMLVNGGAVAVLATFGTCIGMWLDKTA